MPPPILHGPRLALRPPRGGDRADRLSYGRDPEFHRLVGGDPASLRPLTAEDVDRWYAALAAEPYAWVLDVDGRCAGTARLHAVDERNRGARYAIGIFAPADRGLGLGTEATGLVLDFAFGELGLHRVELRVLELNHAAIRCYERCGFVREGVERESVLLGGRWESDVRMSILEHEHPRSASA